MTASEFSFLALGLVLGLVSGAAIVEFVRARPRSPHEVKLTISHDAIPRRASTLADDAFTVAAPEPARGGPADRRLIGSPLPRGASERRTTVRFGPGAAAPRTAAAAAGGARAIPGAFPIARDAGSPMPGRAMQPALPLTGPPASGPAPGPATGPRPDAPTGSLVAITITGGDDPVMKAITSGPAAGTGVQSGDGTVSPTGRLDTEILSAQMAVGASTAIALLDSRLTPPPDAPPADSPSEPPVAVVSSQPATPVVSPLDTGRCPEERLLADERCEFATRARARASMANDALRLAQRTYDAHEAAAVTAAWGADPRAIHDAKDSAQGGFRAAVHAAVTPDALEAAARDWLSQINRINSEAREATATAAREHAAAAAIGASLERLGLEADAARIASENADEACLRARVVVADCDERTASEAAPPLVAIEGDEPWRPRLEDDETLDLALRAGETPRIFRMLRGDRQAMKALVASIAADDAEARRRWQLLMSGLVEAIVADAIEASALDYPADHDFWSIFARMQSREVSRALASLGFRFDGLGGWADERMPSQRDLSLALGYAGIDPMRMRHWPTADETLVLYRDVTVAADEYLAGAAPDLTLAEMVAMLGRRADGLAEVWNHWGQIRPLLLDEG